MSSKVKNTVIIGIILIAIIALGSAYTFYFQKKKVTERVAKIKELNLYKLDTDYLKQHLVQLNNRIAQLDSILANRKYTIPFNLSQYNFYDFINQVSFGFSKNSFVNIEYNETEPGATFNIHHYTLNGTASFDDLYSLVYGIEESKQLKKIANLDLSNNVKVDADGTPYYLVNFKCKVLVYFTNDERFAIKGSNENNLTANYAYDFFYPLIRNEIPPNRDKLLDVQTAQLLALIPDGAFLADASGNTYLLWEGDQVYLGYLTNIDYQKNEVNFVLNKGGIIENVAIKLEKEKKQSK